MDFHVDSLRYIPVVGSILVMEAVFYIKDVHQGDDGTAEVNSKIHVSERFEGTKMVGLDNNIPDAKPRYKLRTALRGFGKSLHDVDVLDLCYDMKT
ncbi:hypothetical protein LTR10_023715 [Elasticomyces elasticus]|uniref:Uncharacterized protein n=1 Tax=Exophiala sideris TaxID=1016849 RepID=A0ABR0IWB2_9EURO|nr:hypothetical protein LTR10_023715 [Elasticomyces elasticus]KAK5020953.1 hypothetical protein LTS07_011334 [Exophiala sideris]KAK5023117.1 hypothetical protein LTR13_011323 [Exophiala sideris]KAK5048445.1 hypothetical protein LTR69_011359 [Exophiala sideris]KAK5176099.1 hypothetical protein LTR44_011344 [Eurotiomycetes sp. CCFEE 6388]